LLAGYLGTAWAQAVNRHFEPSVGIQSDRDHHVITTGPYAHVRHPGYIFGVIFEFGVALALYSPWALLPAFLFLVLLVIRTNLGDATLQRELPGYAGFAARVRYKWIPGIW
jgi:protein-S-isoprenylcysteine O-methyltransferase Ste14